MRKKIFKVNSLTRFSSCFFLFKISSCKIFLGFSLLKSAPYIILCFPVFIFLCFPRLLPLFFFFCRFQKLTLAEKWNFYNITFIFLHEFIFSNGWRELQKHAKSANSFEEIKMVKCRALNHLGSKWNFIHWFWIFRKTIVERSSYSRCSISQNSFFSFLRSWICFRLSLNWFGDLFEFYVKFSVTNTRPFIIRQESRHNWFKRIQFKIQLAANTHT